MSIEESAHIALDQCLQLKKSETLLVVCDPPCFDIGQVLWETGRKLCSEAIMVQMAPRKENGTEPPQPLEQWFGQFDVAVMPTSKSLSHTEARRTACQKGTRIATLPGITQDMFERTLKTDWDELSAYTHKIADALNNTETILIESATGTHLTFKTGGRKAKVDDGNIGGKGDFGNLPAGEAYLAPLEGTANGTLVIDGSFPVVGLLDSPLILTIKDGYVENVSGHSCGKVLESFFDDLGKNSRNIAEFGVGTLSSAKISGKVLEDEKVRGTIHIAIGDNASMGGTIHVPLHLDGVVRTPSVLLDGIVWMKDGIVD